MLETAGLLEVAQDSNDKRILRYLPTKLDRNNSEQTGRLENPDSSQLDKLIS